MSGPSYQVERVYGGYRVMEEGQEPPGMFIGDDWLRNAGFGPLSRSNIQDVINATLYNVQGGTLTKFNPADIPIKRGFRNYPSHPTKGRLPVNPPRNGLVIAKR